MFDGKSTLIPNTELFQELCKRLTNQPTDLLQLNAPSHLFDAIHPVELACRSGQKP